MKKIMISLVLGLFCLSASHANEPVTAQTSVGLPEVGFFNQRGNDMCYITADEAMSVTMRVTQYYPNTDSPVSYFLINGWEVVIMECNDCSYTSEIWVPKGTSECRIMAGGAKSFEVQILRSTNYSIVNGGEIFGF